ncbi:unnamed protein product, partial [Effrenium voratum]
RYGVAITWDPVDFSKPVDLDLQAIIIDRRGYIDAKNLELPYSDELCEVDAVYYNNLVALNGAVSHSGDEVTGQASDFDEMVWAVFAKLPDQVKMLLFVVAACGDSALRDAANATVHVVQEFHGHTVLRFPCEKSRADVDVIVMMEKDNDGKWWLYQVEEPAEHGEHFLDILEPTVGDIIRRRIDNAPKLQRVTFQMKKGAAVDLPKNALKRLNFSVMATIKAKVRKEIDLDISAVFADKAPVICFFEPRAGALRSPGASCFCLKRGQVRCAHPSSRVLKIKLCGSFGQSAYLCLLLFSWNTFPPTN